MSQIYNSLVKAEIEKQRGSKERPFPRNVEPEEAKGERDTVINFPQEKVDTLKLVKGLDEKGLLDEQSAHSLSPLFFKLASSIKTNLDAIKTLAGLSRGKFEDVQFENDFIKTVDEYIHGAHSGVECFLDYLRVTSPVRKKNTVHTILEEILDGNEKKFKDGNIQVVKKQFEKDLPETSVPNDHLRFILNWVVQYASSSLSSAGSIGFLTKSFDFQEVKEEAQAFPKKDGKYIEILIFFITHEKVNESSGAKLRPQGLVRENENNFILPLVEEIIRINRGIMRVKADQKKLWTQISLILPA